MSQFVIGLTGGIGSGKSTVAELFLAQGAALVDTDVIAHELTASGGAAMPGILAAFGPTMADANGALDRTAMRHRVFADGALRKTLENILHPLIKQISAERCAQAQTPYVILAVPLLVESSELRQLCQRVLVVDCPENLQIERVIARNGIAEVEVKAIMAAQATRAQRLALADDIVDNAEGMETLCEQVSRLHLKYLRLSSEKVKVIC